MKFIRSPYYVDKLKHIEHRERRDTEKNPGEQL
jgi:hypothetical protein